MTWYDPREEFAPYNDESEGVSEEERARIEEEFERDMVAMFIAQQRENGKIG